MTTDREKPELKLGAHVLIQLGSELVTDVEQAILECVKNAYDADSPGCLVDIRTTERGVRTEIGPAADLAGFLAPAENVEVTVEELADPVEGESSDDGVGSGDGKAGEDGGATREDDGKVPLVRRSLHYVGRITIEDKGDGLTADQLKTSWLVISRSRKRGKAGEPKGKTAKGRTPLGDKGLGRLGTMKLGDILSVESATDRDGELSTAQFRWADCETAETLDRIPVTLGTSPNPERFKGTRVSVYGLRDIKDWGRRRKVDELTASLASLISPFEGTSSFPVRLRLDGAERSLAAATNEVLKRAVAEFEFRWGDDGSGRRELRTFARLRKDLLAPKRGKEDRTAAVFGADGGAAFEAFLQGQPRRKAWDRIRFDRGGPWYVEAEAAYHWSDILSVDGPELADPGPFEGRLYFFHLDAFEAAPRRDREPELELDAAMPTADPAVAGMAITRDFVKSMTGVSILRDGFRVRSPGDWLDLSAEMTSGSTYGLRAENTIGYFALTGEHNYGLVEKSDREGFVEDATYRGFLELARRCRGFSTNAMVQVRRGLDDYYRTIQTPPGKAPRTAKDAIGAIERNMRTAREAQSLAEDAATNLQAEMDAVARDAAKAGPAAARAMQLANAAMKAIETVRGKLGPDIGSDMTVARLRHEFEDRQEQAIALFESAAVGLSARGLAHELRTHLTEIRSRATALHAAAGSGAGEAALMPHLRAIRGACSAIQNAAALIDPMLPRSRSTRETFSVASFAEEYVANRSLSFEQAGIAVEVVDGGEGAQVRMNRARLLQVFDNLVRNSVYWVQRGVALGEGVGAPAIRIGVEPGGFTVSDTGPGVDPRVEDSLFELFVSGKPDRDGGQGIGLFIIGQLLGLDGCRVGLLPDRNANGRRYVFSVDLSAVTV